MAAVVMVVVVVPVSVRPASVVRIAVWIVQNALEVIAVPIR